MEYAMLLNVRPAQIEHTKETVSRVREYYSEQIKNNPNAKVSNKIRRVILDDLYSIQKLVAEIRIWE